MSNAIQKTEVQGITEQTGSSAVTPMEMVNNALQKGVDADQLSKLLDLQERWEAANARREYLTAMQGFKANPPRIVKDKEVAYKNTRYKHASHAQVSEVIGQALAKHGISHRWNVEQQQGEHGQMIAVTCTLTHTSGHSESVTMYAPPDDSGNKNSIQQIASATTYLQRYTLQSVTGLAAEDDNDGAGWDLEPVSDDQAAQIRDMMESVEADEDKFLAHIGAKSVSTIPARKFKEAMGALRAKQRKAAK